MAPPPFVRSRLAQPLERLFARTGGGIRYDLQTIRALLAIPAFAPAPMRHVLIVGTNGKGSTTALLCDALRRSGHRTGRFTSPHLQHFEERIVIDGEPAAPEAIWDALSALAEVEEALPRPYSFFEGTVAIAAHAFRANAVELAVWEAGLGGRLDATNALPSESMLAIGVTPIGLDHQAILGKDVVRIAHEKAGVFRPHVPIVSAPQTPEVLEVLSHHAQVCRAPFEVVDEAQVRCRSEGLPTGPEYQRINAAVADTLAQVLHARGVWCPPSERLSARRYFAWPGRYQWVDSSHDGPAAWLLDGAHNAPASVALAAAVAQDTRLQNKRICLLFSALGDKDVESLLVPLLPLAHEVHVAACHSSRSYSATSLASLAHTSHVHASVPQALQSLAATKTQSDVVIAFGSLVLIGEVLTWLQARSHAPVAPCGPQNA